jgi:hypothetical protein
MVGNRLVKLLKGQSQPILTLDMQIDIIIIIYYCRNINIVLINFFV